MFAASARNAVGCLGPAVISARLFGGGPAWLLSPGTYGPALLLGVNEDNTPEWWARPIEHPTARSAATIATVLWLTAFALPAAQPRPEERAEAV
ncbi:hypothetical protein I3F58_06970 [Streptomyces sp. MUM 203J]|uniref:hypothetical protein n=1 Tax=Streptomyces sp. MUM 203J TaxID=2791990 RepID=UPI001F04FCF2|nr:hypothetical protein [Streptomyces sp. MUM 203J]MCH0539305.1 hypothetical protein [Streptomyces sp. MUM 203J]